MDYSYSSSASSLPPEAVAGMFAFVAIIWLIMLVFILAVYIYMAICLMKIAKKTNTENAWFAWIPILNLILMMQIAKKPMWWLIFFFVPILNIAGIVFGVLVWMGVCERLGKDKWLGLLILVPIANIILPGYLAFSKTENAPQAA